MIYILSLILIVIEQSLPCSLYIISLPFIAYLANQQNEKNILATIGVAIIISLQTDDFIKNSVVLIIFYLLVGLLAKVLKYRKRSLFLITILEIVVYLLQTYGMWNEKEFIFNILGFFIVNIIYIHISLKAEKKSYEKE